MERWQYLTHFILINVMGFIQIGQPQMIKLVQPSGKTISGLMTSTISGPVKLFKSSPTNAESSQVIKFIFLFKMWCGFCFKFKILFLLCKISYAIAIPITHIPLFCNFVNETMTLQCLVTLIFLCSILGLEIFIYNQFLAQLNKNHNHLLLNPLLGLITFKTLYS